MEPAALAERTSPMNPDVEPRLNHDTRTERVGRIA